MFSFLTGYKKGLDPWLNRNKRGIQLLLFEFTAGPVGNSVNVLSNKKEK